MEKIARLILIKGLTILVFLYSSCSYFINKFIEGESELPFKTLLSLPHSNSLLTYLSVGAIFIFAGLIIIIINNSINYSLTVASLLFLALCFSFFTKTTSLVLLIAGTFLFIILLLAKRKTWLNNPRVTFYILSFALLSSTFLLNSIDSAILHTESSMKSDLIAEDRLKSMVSSAFRDRDLSFKTGLEGLAIDQKIDEGSTKYFGQFNSSTCNESGSSSLATKDRFDYRLVQGLYYTRPANSGNLWLHDSSGLTQNFMDIKDLGKLNKIGDGEKWTLCETLKNILPKVSNLENTSTERDSTRYFSIKIDNKKLVYLQNRNLWVKLEEELGLRGLDLLSTFQKFKLNPDYKLTHSVLKYELDNNGILSTLYIGDIGEDKSFIPSSKIVFSTSTSDSVSIAKPNGVDRTPRGAKEILQIKNR